MSYFKCIERKNRRSLYGYCDNWSFLNQGVVDELSLLLSPVADGDPNTPTVFERMEQSDISKPALFHLKSVSQLQNDIVHLIYITENQED